MAAEISVHDNRIVSYAVDCRERQIILHTVFCDSDPHEKTDVLFWGVVCYHFECDNFGNIVFDVAEASPEEVYTAHGELFKRLKNFAWPSLDYSTEEDLMGKLRNAGVKGFVISSSYGMEGFVLAEGMRLVPVA